MTDEDKRYQELTDHIRSVFDEHEEPDADAGWALLREKYPAKKDRNLAWLFWYAAAAVLLLFTGLWFLRKPDGNNAANNNNVAHVKPVQPTKENKGHVITTPPATQAVDTVVSPINHSGTAPILAGNKNTLGGYHQAAPVQAVTPRSQATSNQTNANQSVITKPDTAPANNNTAIANNKPASPPGKSIVDPTPAAQTQTDSQQVNKSTQMANNSVVKQPQQPMSSADAMNKLLAADNQKDNAKQNNKTAKKALFGIYAATYFNYAKGSDNTVNVGAGLSSDFKLSKHLRLSTGVAIGQNTLNYNSATPQDKIVATMAAASAFANVASVSQGKGTAVPESINRNYAASLIGLDIPVNLKFQFNPERNDTYIAAGLSSGTFINETYTTNYNFGQTQQQSTVTKTFSGFDLAKTLNLSFGMGYPLGKANRLIVEPFVKYPLDGVGSQQLKFGAGGVNLKLSFTGKK
ncbi:hypothetical protein C8P68_106264 [Mucilaginibacter yixingensis]|uniref:Outer membrane protein with beta-barrel domain n=1 Tax=Mucilaginibacter yixingensis TaxID=1295612 RepID=A0A2T5J7G6_9SPHI|nr:hypothetical protein [Mucilaginibacter yixingensis]PTQ95049.1 hypothetical protein C8P68_106264 [Mucilaginibacter yixingensis]